MGVQFPSNGKEETKTIVAGDNANGGVMFPFPSNGNAEAKDTWIDADGVEQTFPFPSNGNADPKIIETIEELLPEEFPFPSNGNADLKCQNGLRLQVY